MSYKKIPLKSLLINSANDRHGELENETAAIAWLFSNLEPYMRNLARDIATTGEIYEAPLVSPDGETYVVFDGNRRMTCLKLLAEPKRAPTVELQKFFSELRGQWEGTFPADVTCQIETDRERIDDILYRRHTGTQGGVGRSPWNDRMTANFVERTGQSAGTNVADEIEKRLAAAGMLPSKKIPWSTANRLLSSEGLRNRVGISVSKGKFRFTHDESVVLPALRRIADDLAKKNVVLGDLWKTTGKQDYLDSLESEGLLPTAADALAASPGGKATGSAKGASGKATRPVRARREQRTTLIPQIVFPVVWGSHLQRHRAVWNELQFELKLDHHPNAISVLFRVLFELAIENYIARTGLSTVHKDAKLVNKALAIGEDLLLKQKIDSKYAGVIRKLTQADAIFSIDTMNRYVHSPDFAPSPSHLTALWDQSATLIVHALNA